MVAGNCFEVVGGSGGVQLARNRLVVAGRGRSLRAPVPPARGTEPARRSLPVRFLYWPGWKKLAAMATTVATIGASGAAVAALWFSGQSLRATDDQYDLSRQTAVTDRFRVAAEQLSSDKINVRLSGIYLLERLAKDSPADQPTVFTLLTSFLRTHPQATACTAEVSGPTTFPGPVPDPPDATPIDVQAVLTAIVRRDPGSDDIGYGPDLDRLCLPRATLSVSSDAAPAPLRRVRLDRTYLRGGDLRGANLSGSQLAFADLSFATLSRADLTGARLGGANLVYAGFDDGRLLATSFDDANLSFATFSGADLTGATFDRANLTRANFARANLSEVNFAGARLTEVNLDGANLAGADLTGATLAGADLAGADLTGAVMDGANLDGVTHDEATIWPKGFRPPPAAR